MFFIHTIKSAVLYPVPHINLSLSILPFSHLNKQPHQPAVHLPMVAHATLISHP